MHVRISKKSTAGKTYQYAQLVESYRRESDGMPMHRVVMNLSHLSPLEIDNLRTSLEASRRGKKVVVVKAPGRRNEPVQRPKANLRYLDLAVLLEVWKEWQLDQLFDELLPCGQSEVAPSAVIAALAIQRCVDPGSKLSAERWFPDTALPELLGVSPDSFNNTRVHRVLDALDQCKTELTAKLPRRYTARDGPFSAMFIDVTDTWFVGHGPEMAERGKTKEGHVRRKVGIVLLCNQDGYPLRWQVIHGNESDKHAITEMIEGISRLSWVGDAPIVCDRAMGSTAQIQQLLDAKVRFLTALTRHEFGVYSDKIPYQCFAPLSLQRPKTNKQRKQLVARVAALAEAAGMTKIDDKLYVLDLKLIERAVEQTSSDTPTAQRRDSTIEAMQLGQRIREAVAEGEASSLADAARMLGLGKTSAFNYAKLTRLAEDIQRAIVDGKAQGLTVNELRQLSNVTDLDAQHAAFESLLDAVQLRRLANKRTQTAPQQAPADPISPEHPGATAPLRLRGVLYFNPEMFIDQRQRADDRLAEIDAFVAELNARLASPRCKLSQSKAHSAIDQKLRSHSLLDAYDVDLQTVDGPSNSRFVVKLSLRADQWARRRQYDGFSLLVAHPEVEQSAPELCQLYRAKDVVEKDFETIKSLVKLRPVWHRLDAKVRAHVHICMLSLLLERTLKRKLAAARSTAHSALAELVKCRLNVYPADGADTYALNEVSPKQDAILRSLKLRLLADNDEIADRITPR